MSNLKNTAHLRPNLRTLRIFAFENALEFVLKWEGGYSEHPNDPGGATFKGITQKTYDEFRKENNLKTKHVINIEDSELKTIYRNKYWFAASCHVLDYDLAIAMFDCAVNCGPRRAIRFLQKCLNIKTDGIFGPKTFLTLEEFIEKRNSTNEILKLFLNRREDFYVSLGKRLPEFLKGWLNRLNDLRTYLAEFKVREESN